MVAQMVKSLPAMQETQVWSLGWEDQSTAVFLSGESQEQKSLVCYSPWGHKELDMTEWITLSFSVIYYKRTGKGKPKNTEFKVHGKQSLRTAKMLLW